MAVIWADFPSGQQGLYGSDESLMLDGIWAALEEYSTGNVTLLSDPEATIGSAGRVLRTNNNTISMSGLRFALPAGATETVGVGFRIYMSELPYGNWGSWQGPLIGFRTTGNTGIAYVTVLSNGAIAVATGRDGSGLLGTTSTPVLTSAAWSHVEIKLLRHASAGACEIRVNGVTVLSLTGLALGASNIGQMFIGVNYWNSDNINKGQTYYKDVVFWDTSGSYANDFLGGVAVHDVVPNADVDLNWTPSSGSTGYNLISVGPPVDTNYIYAGDPPPDPAQFSLTNLPVDVTSVKAVLPVVRAWKNDGGDCTIQSGVSPNDTDWYNGTDRPITTAPTYWWDVSHTSPATAAPWTPAEVDASDIRINRTT